MIALLQFGAPGIGASIRFWFAYVPLAALLVAAALVALFSFGLRRSSRDRQHPPPPEKENR